MTTIYEGTRDSTGTAHVYRIAHDRRRQLNKRLDLENHSPTGFEWGYGGSGPAQLALALLADVLRDGARAVRLHQPFKWRVITPLPRNQPWRLTADEISLHVIALELERNDQ